MEAIAHRGLVDHETRVGVPRDLPQVTVRILEVSRVASPGALRRGIRDPRTSRSRERDHLIDTDGFPDWDYLPWEGEAEPFEYKASDWGWLDGHLLSLDYSAPALTTAEEMAQIIANRQS